MKRKLTLFPILCCALFLHAQEPVAFTIQSSLLGSISGFNYNDCAVDMNGDFLDDIVRVTSSNLYIDYQQPNGTFLHQQFSFSPQNEPDWSICAGDLDANGFNDLLFGAGNAVSFVFANDDGTVYTEKPMAGFIFSQRSTMADIDNDGDLDAFVCHDIGQSHPYRNMGNGFMQLDQTLIETYARPGNYAAIWTDYDNDGDIDLYITKCKGGALPGDIDRTNLLYQNNGDGTFSEVAEQAGLADNAQSWSTVFEDFDNDGDFDAFIVNHDFKNRLYRNNGDGTFTDVIEQSGIDPNDLGAWENASGDFNNDGFMDIFSELENEFYLGNGDLTFTGQTTFEALSSGGIGDFNNDGFLDVVRGNGLWINKGNDNNWLKVNTVGKESNINGIGARVEIYGAWGRQIREVRSGQSFAPMSSLQIHFGIGQADAIDKVVVKWPSGAITSVDNPAINTTITIQETGCLLPPTNLVVNGSTSICPGDSVILSTPKGFSYAWSNGDSTQTLTVTDAGTYSVELTDTSGCVSLSNEITVTMLQDIAPTIDVEGFGLFCEGSSITLTSSDGNNYNWSNGMMGQSITLDDSATLTVSIDAVCSQDQISSDAVTVSKVAAATVPVVSGTTINQGQFAEIMATGNNLEWYDQPVGGNLLATGNTFNTGTLDLTTTFYVESHNVYADVIQNGGKPDNAGGGGLALDNLFNYFDAWEPFTLLSVKVYAAVPQVDTIYLMNSNGDILQQKTVSIVSGEQVLDLGFDVPQGTDFFLRSYEGQLFRNDFGVQFPYPIGEVGEITTTPIGNGYYFYFYDWKVKRPDLVCSSERIPVTIDVTDANEVFHRAGFSISPNPANQELFVTMLSKAERISIYDLQGRSLFVKKTSGEGIESINIHELPAGIYLLQINSNNELFHTKFVKE